MAQPVGLPPMWNSNYTEKKPKPHRRMPRPPKTPPIYKAQQQDLRRRHITKQRDVRMYIRQNSVHQAKHKHVGNAPINQYIKREIYLPKDVHLCFLESLCYYQSALDDCLKRAESTVKDKSVDLSKYERATHIICDMETLEEMNCFDIVQQGMNGISSLLYAPSKIDKLRSKLSWGIEGDWKTYFEGKGYHQLLAHKILHAFAWSGGGVNSRRHFRNTYSINLTYLNIPREARTTLNKDLNEYVNTLSDKKWEEFKKELLEAWDIAAKLYGIQPLAQDAT